MVTALVMLAAGALIGSGVLIKHERWITWLALAGVLWEGQWLLISWTHRALLPDVSKEISFLAGALALLVFWGVKMRQWQRPRGAKGEGWHRELPVVSVTLVVLAAAVLIAGYNNWNGGTWTVHGFYNGDTATLISLTQASLETNRLVALNPFAAGTGLEYPAVVHGALADFIAAIGRTGEWLKLLPLMTYVQIIITLPLFFLLWDLITPRPGEMWRLWYGVEHPRLMYWVQACIVLTIAALSWDNYVYPQSHFFLTALFLLEVIAFARAQPMNFKEQLLPAGTGLLAAVLLMGSNAVLGAAAAAVAIAWGIVRAADKKRLVAERAVWVLSIPVLGGFFLSITTGNGAFGWPNFSYTAALDMVRLAPYVIALSAAAWWQAAKKPFVSLASVACFGLAFVTFFFSTRNIVAENASRFFYEGLLVGMPLLIYPLIRAVQWARRELWHTSHTVAELLIGYGAAATIIMIFLLPAGASMASAHDNLMFKDTQVIDEPVQKGMAWLNNHSSPEALIIASPEEPWIVPVLAGRAMLRTNYWLSPDDGKLADITAAFRGEQEAQKTVKSLADYLVVTKPDRVHWQALKEEPIFDNGAVVIYRGR